MCKMDFSKFVIIFFINDKNIIWKMYMIILVYWEDIISLDFQFQFFFESIEKILE